MRPPRFATDERGFSLLELLVALLILGMVRLVVLSVRCWWARRQSGGRFGDGAPPPSYLTGAASMRANG